MAFYLGPGLIGLGQEDMEESIKRLEENTFQYAEEAWEDHKEEVLEALWIIDQCKSLVDWAGRRSVLVDLKNLWDEERWLEEGETIWGEYPDEILQMSSISRNVPLKLLLMSVIQDMEEDPNNWDRAANGMLFRPKLQGAYEWYIVCIYFVGAKAIYTGKMWDRDSFRTWKDGRFPWWRYGSVFSRTMVPDRWLKEYDEYNQKLIQEQKEREQAEWEKMKQEELEHERSIDEAFNRVFGEMEESGLRYILEHVNGRVLAAAALDAEEPVKNRLLEHMTARRREFVEKLWRLHEHDDYFLCYMLENMDQMLMMAGLVGGSHG